MACENILSLPALFLLEHLFAPCVNCWIPQVINGGPQRGMGIVQGVPRDTPTPPELWYEFQRLDHFNPKDHSSWQQVFIHVFCFMRVSFILR